MKVQELLNESNWIKVFIAADKDGNNVDYDDPSACKWCLYGAMLKCYGAKANFLRLKILVDKGLMALGGWNDAPERTWQDIEALIKKYDL